jgi:hypothetical protein
MIARPPKGQPNPHYMAIWLGFFVVLQTTRGDPMFVLKNDNNSLHDMTMDLREYVGYATSKDIINEMKQMEFDKILLFKQSLEEILNIIGLQQDIVH